MIVVGEEAKMGRQFRGQGNKVVYQRLKELLINQAAHLEMQLMEGQMEKARGRQGKIKDREWSQRRVDLGTNFVIL